MAITTSAKRSFLEDAWDAAKAANPNTPDLRTQLRSLESSTKKNVANGSMASVGANGRTSAFSLYGPGQITPAEIVEVYRELIDLYGGSKNYLNFCAKYALDPFTTEITCTPNPLPAAVQNPVIVDTVGYFTPLCSEFNINVGDVAGQAVSDKAIFLWMMGHLIAVTEARSDYTRMRIGEGMQFV